METHAWRLLILGCLIYREGDNLRPQQQKQNNNSNTGKMLLTSTVAVEPVHLSLPTKKSV